MADQIYNKIIKIVSKEEKNGKIKVTDQDGDKFSFFKKKTNGESTSAYEQFKNMNLDEGSSTKVGYVLENFEIEGKQISGKKIINFMEAKEEQIEYHQSTTVEKEQVVEPLKEGAKKLDEDFWDKKAYKQCLWNYWLQHESGKTFDGDTRSWEDRVWEVFKSIEKDADERFF